MMKRILCLVVAFMMCFSYAALADDYDFLNTSYDSYEAELSCTFIVNEPMTVLKLVSELMEVDNYVNLQMLTENFCNSTSTGVIKLNTSDNYAKGKVSYEIFETVPFAINRNLKVTAEMNMAMWLEWDITDDMNPVFRYIMQYPYADKYISMDLIELLAEEGVPVADFISSIKGYYRKDYITEISSKVIDIIRKNSSLETKGDNVKITLTATQLENTIAGYMDFIVDEFDDNEDYDLLADGDTGYISEILPDSEDVKEFFSEYPLFDETALVIDFTKTSDGTLKNLSSTLNMDIDLKGFIEETGITLEENESTNLKFSLKSDVAYKSVNGNVEVTFPEVSEDDIISFSDFFYPEYEYDPMWDTEYCWHNEDIYKSFKYIPSANNTFYVSLDKILEHGERYGYDYECNVSGETITLTETTGKDSFSKAEMTLGSNEIVVDGVAHTLTNPVIISENEVFVDNNGLNYIFGYTTNYAKVDLTENTLRIELLRHSPQCHHTEEEIYGWYEEDYDEYTEECEHYQEVFASSDEFPYYGVPYIRIRDIIDDVWYNCEVNYENNVLTLTDPTGESGFTTFVVTIDSNEYIVDGVAKRVGMPATEYQDSVYIDVNAAVEIFGFELVESYLEYYKTYEESETWYATYYATLIRKAPYCIHTEEELADYYKWWE